MFNPGSLRLQDIQKMKYMCLPVSMLWTAHRKGSWMTCYQAAPHHHSFLPNRGTMQGLANVWDRLTVPWQMAAAA